MAATEGQLWEVWWLLPFMTGSKHGNVTQVVLDVPGWMSWQCLCCSEILLSAWLWFWEKHCYLKWKILNSRFRAITYFDWDFTCRAAGVALKPRQDLKLPQQQEAARPLWPTELHDHMVIADAGEFQCFLKIFLVALTASCSGRVGY